MVNRFALFVTYLSNKFEDLILNIIWKIPPLRNLLEIHIQKKIIEALFGGWRDKINGKDKK